MNPAPPITAIELARLAATLPGAASAPHEAVRQAYALWQAAEAHLRDQAAEDELAALAAAQDAEDFLTLDEAMRRTGHKLATAFHRRARETCPNLDRLWLGPTPGDEAFAPDAVRVHQTVPECLLDAERKAGAARKRKTRANH